MIGAWTQDEEDDGHAANCRVVRPDGPVRQLRSLGRLIDRGGDRHRRIRGLTLDLTGVS